MSKQLRSCKFRSHCLFGVCNCSKLAFTFPKRLGDGGLCVRPDSNRAPEDMNQATDQPPRSSGSRQAETFMTSSVLQAVPSLFHFLLQCMLTEHCIPTQSWRVWFALVKTGTEEWHRGWLHAAQRRDLILTISCVQRQNWRTFNKTR